MAILDWKNPLIIALLLIPALGANVLICRSGLNDRPINSYSPFSGDALEYTDLAQKLEVGMPFSLVFSNAYRLPGYPTFLALCARISESPWLLARLIQIFLGSLVVVLFGSLVLHITSDWRIIYIGMATAIIWQPLHYFGAILYPEALSIFFLALLMFILGKFSHYSIGMIVAGSILAMMVYLKPNHILFVVPVIGYVMASGREYRAKALLVAITVFALIAPWSVFASVNNGRLIPLSTTQGYNLLIGSGGHPQGCSLTRDGLVQIAYKKLKLEAISVAVASDDQGPPPPRTHMAK